MANWNWSFNMKFNPGDLVQFTFHENHCILGNTDDLYGIILEDFGDGIRLGVYYKKDNKPVTKGDNDYTIRDISKVIPYYKIEHGQYLLEF
jgi:hypothetical protein